MKKIIRILRLPIITIIIVTLSFIILFNIKNKQKQESNEKAPRYIVGTWISRDSQAAYYDSQGNLHDELRKEKQVLILKENYTYELKLPNQTITGKYSIDENKLGLDGEFPATCDIEDNKLSKCNWYAMSYEKEDK